MKILGSPDVADVLASHTYEVAKLVSEPNCRIIKQLKINYNYIECLDGMFFDIEGKCFVEKPENLDGSPRAFILYKFDQSRPPKPKPFIEGNYLP